MFSVIVCSHKPARAAHISAQYARLFGGEPHELIVVDDAKSLCEGYNRGIARSTGDLLILSHDDIEFIASDTISRVREHLRHFDLIGIAGTTNLVSSRWDAAGDPFSYMLVVYPEGDRYAITAAGAPPLIIEHVEALDGVFIACQREVVDAIPFDEMTFDGWHLYDLDFSYRAFRAGYELAVCRDLPLVHYSIFGPNQGWDEYRERFEAKHCLPRIDRPFAVARIEASRVELARKCQPDRVADLLANLSAAAVR